MRGVSVLVVLAAVTLCAGGEYFPDWSSLDTRPSPSWYDEAKIGIFLHWGVFSVPSFKSEWFWNLWQNDDFEVIEFLKKNYPPGWTYADFAPQFRAEFFDPDRWAALFEKSGAKYVVLTSKHHEGFTNWPSSTAFNWNSRDIGPGRDLVGDLRTAVRKRSLRFGVYHSMMDWYHQLYLKDKQNNWKTQHFVEAKCNNELYELVNQYEPDILWSDGEWEAPSRYWNSTNFLAWLYNESPVKDVIVVNDRWGKETRCKHGDFYNCDDRFNPGTLQEHKWENCMSLDRSSWGYRRTMTLDDVLTIEELLKTLAETISCHGNILINVGPRSDGTIDPLFEERLTQLGEWLQLNGEAVYGSRPWKDQRDAADENVWYTQNNGNVYGIVTSWPQVLKLGSFNSTSFDEHATVTIIGYDEPLLVSREADGITIHFPALSSKSKPIYLPVLEFALPAKALTG
ncbi:alpha-L-fucosidase [Galendromus occidentalis]|uniref:Putative alpha-L-fucosidase n=1 Tax=Galendromus occidentalis TaxID=34638 RepID=A0AAJ6QPM4_9ACAR|nr:alpha-L-fucosidase [Galendromus occidentalis]